MERIANKSDRDLGESWRFDSNTEEQFLEHKQRQFEEWVGQQAPLYDYKVEVQGMKKTVVMDNTFPQRAYRDHIRGVWAQTLQQYPKVETSPAMLLKYPEGRWNHEAIIVNSHATETSYIKIMVTPKPYEHNGEVSDRKGHEQRVCLGYRDFDKEDREFNVISNCESFKFSATEIAGLDQDESRNEIDDYEGSLKEEDELMANMEIDIIPEDTDGFLRNMVKERDILRAHIESEAITW